ncbi:MAG: 2-oxoglutarate dehydrogenase complex dihydrolipoyllysine-residue succinyltransferase [Maricaulaceae bacterium]|jgi:2-oxoglutarate dehydrogenase E2 component (dihydrolipoamide succinyltransferase)
MTDIVVPTLGESVTEATVGKWLKQPGDAVAKDDPVVELETDKVTIEAPAPEDGVMSEIVAPEGATVEIGALLGRIENGAVNGAAKPKAQAAAAPAAQKAEEKSEAKPAPKADAGGDLVDVTLPAMGESVTEGTVGEWRIAPGEAVSQDDPLVEIETDKVAVEVPSPVDGVLEEQLVEQGATVEVGALIARVRAGAQASAAPVKAEPAPSRAPAAASAVVMPAAQRVVDENGLDPSTIEGTGRGGRILKADALAALEARDAGGQGAPASGGASVPAEARSQELRALEPREERVPMSRLRKTIARRLKEAQNTAAMLTTFNEADMSAIMEVRKKYKDLFDKKHGIKLGFMSFFVSAAVQALKDIPAVNAEIDGESIIYKNYYDIGIAVGTDKGLVVPVVRDADQMSLGEVELAIAELGTKARDGKLTIDDMQGATFTISNGGVYGSLMSTPILNAPQSGILGMHKIQERPMVVDGQVVARPMMYLALSYDHRIVDGKEAVTFLVRMKELLEDPERLLLDL